MAIYLRTFPGEVRMPRAGADEALYAARARAVMSFLSEREVKADAVTIVDRQPDGDGIASYRVVEALAAENQTDKNNGKSGSFEIPMLVPGRSNASNSMRNSK
jgi:hypothetical protein